MVRFFKHVLGRLQARGGVYMFCKTHVKLGGNAAIMGTSLVPIRTGSSLIFRLTSVFCDTDGKGLWTIGEGVAFWMWIIFGWMLFPKFDLKN